MDGDTITLSDGRQLGYASYGKEDGTPIIYFHGTPSSRIHPVTSMLDAITQQPSGPALKIIALERPGFGLSDPLSNRSLKDWVRDVDEATDILDLGPFALLGVSGGGPYAMACSYSLAKKVTKTAVIAGMGPLAVPELFNALSEDDQESIHDPKKLAEFIKQINADPGAYVNNLVANLPESDRSKIPDQMIYLYKQTMTEASKNSQGIICDYKNFAEPWNIPFGDIEGPITFWHSEDDQNVPLSHAEYLSEKIPTAILNKLNGLSHFSSVLSPLPDVAQYLNTQN